MTTTIIQRVASGLVISAFAVILALAVPHSAKAWYGGNYYHSYPPAPNFYTIPSVQVVYPNGYYQNYFVPTVRFFPAPAPLPVVTQYYPPYYQTPVPVYNHNW